MPFAAPDRETESGMAPKRSMTFTVMPLALMAAGCGRAPETVAANPQITVPVVKVEREDLAHGLEVAAEFRPVQEIELHAKVSGYLKSIPVDVGDRVQAGQTLAVLEAPEMAQDAAQAEAALRRSVSDAARAKAEVQRAEAAYKLRKLSYERISEVVKTRPRLVAQQELDDARGRYEEAEGQLAAAKAALAATEEQIGALKAAKERVATMAQYLRITAPFAGVITRRQGDPGAMIQAGTSSHTQALPVVRLSKIDRLRLVLPVPEAAVGKVRIGAPVEVRVDSLNRVIQGRVARTSQRLETATRTMETEVDIPNPDMALLPGMYGYAKLQLEGKSGALAVPVQAVRNGMVQVVKDGVIENRRLTAGLETPEMVEALSGVAEGEYVVLGSHVEKAKGAAILMKVMDAPRAPRER